MNLTRTRPERDLAGYRVVLVHAHPDDEAITTGGTIATLTARGADVLVVTCTLGEEGEVIGEPYQHLVADEANQLGGFRIHELRASLAALGARGTFLGGAGRFRDSGMEGSAASQHSRAFVNSGDTAVDALAAIFTAERPHVVITYGPDGGYGHPDHIRAHEITHAAAKLTDIPRILWAVRLEHETAALMPTEAPAGWRLPQPGELDGVSSSDLSISLNDASYSAKVQSMRAHATQLWIADGQVTDVNPHAALPATVSSAVHVSATHLSATVSSAAAQPVVYYALSNLIVQPIQRVEHFQLGEGAPLPTEDNGAVAGDAAALFAGIDK
ncbi:1D-myo-inositol 2-acetamido-2-deoxy-alpha-D-glucopyranoside deacetylase [Corynebacterium glaucum]|uniref:1D-myo-inositol 2-acetamido-2-deoxy-alpha-D-glucopyranoside deacetylase n=1 Tax=Corynebacterium glaucum TaxID=187491 RepID=A0A1Q2HVT0_9CORY|nr:N-acetyl-1-D-myo-inositol-2-amino-2-deoxy-alpha-D-glucopyranoside deacetylase [Corynebacterium glaucum]AQQ14943.1 1D-myo-inositol 2-acetamido-2-deoxy-alpha-D-glucopyranoside deacetylase [Corynebacterium glaucum]